MAKRKTAAMIVSRLTLQEEGIEPRILAIRNQRVLLDRDLAILYEVKAIALRQQVRRNPKRFPKDFVFELREIEIDALVSQNVIPSRQSLGGAKPPAFTEQGVAMLSSVLSSDRAIEANLVIMRTFVNMRKSLAGHEELMGYLKDMALTQNLHSDQIQEISEKLNWILNPPLTDAPRRQIGYPAGA